MGQDHGTDELFSRPKRCAGRTKHCPANVTTGQKHDRYHHRRRARTFRSKWRVRPASERLEYDLGSKSETRSRYFGISTKPLSLVRNGRRYPVPAARLANARRPAQNI